MLGHYQGYYKIKLHAPAVDGKANQALISFLSLCFKTPKSHITILSGLTQKKKRVQIEAPTLHPDWLKPLNLL